MKNFSLVEFSIKHPRWVFGLTGILTLLFLIPFPRLKTDTNPKNMLPITSPVRVWNAEVDKIFGLYEDVLVVGVSNDRGIYNEKTLSKVKAITDAILKIDGVASIDVASLSTIDNVKSGGGTLNVSPLMREVPKEPGEFGAIESDLKSNPMLVGRIASSDGKTTAIYVPLEQGANGKEIADSIRVIVDGIGKAIVGEEKIYVAGDPVARDTFGAVMFKLMALFSPIAGMIMFVAMYLMFRNLALCGTMMAVAMVSIVWSMGLIIGLGFPIHIMSSMAPVFLMAIATDSIHIFNEFYFRYHETGNKRTAILQTMEAVGRPVKFTAMATATGFAVLLFMEIIPVKVFGGLIAFGTIALRILSFTFIPAVLSVLNEEKIKKAAGPEEVGKGFSSKMLLGLAHFGTHRAKVTAAVGGLIILASIYGISMIVVNNNMVEWFTESNEVRQADKAMNEALGGTSLGYLVISSKSDKAEPMKDPGTIKFIDGLQRHLEKLEVVGKTSSVADIVKRVNQALHEDSLAYYSVPEVKNAIGQYMFLFSMSAKPSDLKSMVDDEYKHANVWVQLKSWDAQAMERVIYASKEYQSQHQNELEIRPAGTAYFNMVWNEEVLWDMVKGFALALVIVYAILAVNFHSLKWALVGYVPLLFTIIIIFGAVGYIGKDFDMPIAVLSCLSLGMAVDFAIHFINRFRKRLEETGIDGTDKTALADALLWTSVRPGKGILRNAILFASAFSVMMLAPLTPYITVGVFIAVMMVLSALFTILYLPSLIMIFRPWLFNKRSSSVIQAKARVLQSIFILGFGLAVANSQAVDPSEVIQKMNTHFYYQGQTFRAKVKMKIQAPDGRERLRELSMLRINLPENGQQRFFMYFHSPEDVRRMAFLVNKYPSKEDDRWLFVPSLELVQRIAARDAGSSFAGSDFSYEDISGRDLGADSYKYVKEENIGERLCHVIESIPKASASYKKRISWIDKETYLPLKEEYYDIKGQVVRVFTSDEVSDIGGIPTVVKRTMKNLKTKHQTVVEFSGNEYGIKIESNDFNERALRNPPRSWIQ